MPVTASPRGSHRRREFGLENLLPLPLPSLGEARMERMGGSSLPSISIFTSSASMVSRSSRAAAMRCIASWLASMMRVRRLVGLVDQAANFKIDLARRLFS